MFKLFSKDYYIEEIKLLNTYRTLSWILTSLVYFITDPSDMLIKFGVIFVLLITSIIVVNVYKRYDNISKVDQAFVFIETIGIILILLPTGGLKSPFIWYALNPVLISAYFFSNLFCWFNLICYLSTSTIVTYLFFNPTGISLIGIIQANSQHILIFILITIAVQVLMVINNQLKHKSNELIKTNNKLNEANIRIQESMEQIMSMYQAVEILTSKDNELSFQTFADYTLKLTKAKNAFFYYKPNEKSGIMAISGIIDDRVKEELIQNIETNWDNYLNSSELTTKVIKNSYVIPVQTSSNYYGLLGAEIQDDFLEKDDLKIFKFISDLCAVILERFELDIISERLTKAEEQNRIANEMHDNVTQRLFSISCATHLMANNFRKLTEEQMEEKLISLQESSNAAMKELRSTIYELSAKKNGNNRFIDDIRKYLDNISKLNNININFQFSGDEELLDIQRKNGLYRIISESTGNAIRHCKSKKIDINFIIEDNETSLTINDNGIGFNVAFHENTGLGLRNMSRLIKSYNGKMNITSKIGIGTKIDIIIPNRKTVKSGGF